MSAFVEPEWVVYNITRARRPTDQRSEADTRSRTPGRPPDACTRSACAARGYRAFGGAAQVRGRVGRVNVVPSRLVATPPTPAHGGGARELRSGLRGVWPQAQAPQAAWAVNSARLRDSEEATKDENDESAYTTCLRNRIKPICQCDLLVSKKARTAELGLKGVGS